MIDDLTPRFFPSSKLCSNCEAVKQDLSLAERVYECDNCGISIDRDLNSVLNLKKYGEMYGEDRMVAVSWAETLNACGDHVRPSDGRDPDDEGDDDEA